jgi:hypothetical protein
MIFLKSSIRNGVSIGLGSIISFLSGYSNVVFVQNNLLTEIGNNLVQENGDLIYVDATFVQYNLLTEIGNNLVQENGDLIFM